MRRLTISLTAIALLALGAIATPAAAAVVPRDNLVSGTAILENLASGMCLDQDFGGGTANSRVIAFRCHGGSNQIWLVDIVDRNRVRLLNEQSGKCLDQDYSDGTPHSGILAFDCNGGANQEWIILPYSDSFALRNAMSGMCVDQDYSGGTPHANVLAFACHGQANQRWH